MKEFSNAEREREDTREEESRFFVCAMCSFVANIQNAIATLLCVSLALSAFGWHFFPCLISRVKFPFAREALKIELALNFFSSLFSVSECFTDHYSHGVDSARRPSCVARLGALNSCPFTTTTIHVTSTGSAVVRPKFECVAHESVIAAHWPVLRTVAGHNSSGR